MAFVRFISIPAPLRHRLIGLLPAFGAVSTLAWVGVRGVAHPVSLLLAAIWIAAGLYLVLLKSPRITFALFPLTVVWFWNAPVEPFDLALLLIAGASCLPYLSHWRLDEIRLSRIEWSYCLFLCCLLTTLATPFQVRPLLGVAKSYSIGFLAYKVARHGAHRHGTELLQWGLVALSGVTIAELAVRYATKGVAIARISHHRTELTDVSWGSSNYVAAVLVILIPAALYLMRAADGPWSRRLGAVSFVGTFIGVLLTASRGGLLMALLATLTMVRGPLWTRMRFVVAAAVVFALVVLTPVGNVVLRRFQTPEGVYSAAARWEVWKATWERGLSHLPFGVGHGQSYIQNDALGNVEPHNFPLKLFAEGGPLAVALWLMLLRSVWQRGRVLTRSLDAVAAGRSLMLLALLAFLNSLFEPTFSGNLYFAVFWWSVGALDVVQFTPVPEVATPRGCNDEIRDDRSLISHVRA